MECHAMPSRHALGQQKFEEEQKEIEARGRRAVIHSFYLNTEGHMTSLGVQTAPSAVDPFRVRTDGATTINDGGRKTHDTCYPLSQVD